MTTSQWVLDALPLLEQIRILVKEGLFLGTRAAQDGGINLYHLPQGYFAEVHYNPMVYAVTTFTGTLGLQAYVEAICLPELPSR
ncbi:hypothetical protein [Hymenobacter sp. YC55]|uniref:hypothetical protein n=1 Tax=Hymenobacter sp. YC55 TaxID=3034019 RepID=UPI0023F6C164|nr:hypothetical protein [Hymenobacter sp. YC55]MDF7815071.1 hypothetical protein [Hymenobacter sp. YC55]